MKINYSIISKIICLVLSLASIILTCLYSPTFLSGLSLYASVINLIAFGFILFSLICEIKKVFYQSNMFHTIRGIILVGLISMFFIYYFIISWNERNFNFFNLANIFAKILSPLAFLLDYIFFDKKQEFKTSQITAFLLVPVFYVLFVFISALLGGTFYVNFDKLDFSKFPYFFLNVDLIGLDKVCFWVLGIGAGILLLSFLLITLDQLIPKYIAWLKASPEERKTKDYLKPKTAVSMGLPTEEE